MKKMLLLLTLLYLSASAEEVTLSKDSIRIYTDLLSSFADLVTISNTTDGLISADSIHLSIDTMDTMGWGRYLQEDRFQVRWLEQCGRQMELIWRAVAVAPGEYLLEAETAQNEVPQPLLLEAQSSCTMLMLMLGGCLGCSGLPPEFPAFFQGRLVVFMSNGEILTLHLFLSDPFGTETVRVKSLQRKQKNTKNGQFLLNGQRIDNNLILKKWTGYRRVVQMLRNKSK